MGKRQTISIGLSVSNIGPLRTMTLQKDIRSLQIGVYANNGCGKTFISRMFRLAENSDRQVSISQTDSYLTRTAGNGSLSMEVNNAADLTRSRRSLLVEVKRGSKHIVTDETDYLLHVFNSDYVRENLEEVDYCPSGDIEGYILGKSNIDVTQDKQELSRQLKELKDNRREIEQSVALVQAELVDLGVRQTMNEFRDLTVDNVTNDFTVDEARTLDELRGAYEKVNSLPDDQPDIPPMQFQLDLSSLERIRDLLAHKFERSALPDSLTNRIKAKLAFVEAGLNLCDSDEYRERCPFCQQRLEAAANQLIESYKQYFSDEEAKATREIYSLKQHLQALKDAVHNFERDFLRTSKRYDTTKDYFPSQSGQSLSAGVDFNVIVEALDEIADLLDRKGLDIGSIDLDPSLATEILTNCASDIDRAISVDNTLLQRLNEIKNNSNNEKLSLRRALCRGALVKLKTENKDRVLRYFELRSQTGELASLIDEKESQIRVAKKQQVAATFKYFLDYFFGGKYTLDEDRFILKFDDWALGRDAPCVLSDGEKNIVALCYFLAETHLLVERQSDYNRLFFVIDDPISSMDFHFVYALSQLVRSLKDRFGMSRNRILVLTHNVEFMSILIRNRIIKEAFIMTTTGFFNLKDSLVMPYEHHLRDIYAVATHESAPTHHTPNSIRHVLETINNFQSPDRQLDTFFKQTPELQTDGFLYTLINDGSHGVVRSQSPYTEDEIVRGCQEVIAYISNHFPGQISKIRTA